MSLPSSLQRLRSLLDQVPSHDDVLDLLGGLSSRKERSADRAIAIVGATLLEHGLKVIILGSLVKLKPEEEKSLFASDGRGPLATFHDRTEMAYAMGLIGRKGRRDIDRVRRIRIVFAHGAFDVDFELKAISEVCSQFKLINNAGNLDARAAYIETVAYVSGEFQRKFSKLVTYQLPGAGSISHPAPSPQYLP